MKFTDCFPSWPPDTCRQLSARGPCFHTEGEPSICYTSTSECNIGLPKHFLRQKQLLTHQHCSLARISKLEKKSKGRFIQKKSLFCTLQQLTHLPITYQRSNWLFKTHQGHVNDRFFVAMINKYHYSLEWKRGKLSGLNLHCIINYFLKNLCNFFPLTIWDILHNQLLQHGKC